MYFMYSIIIRFDEIIRKLFEAKKQLAIYLKELLINNYHGKQLNSH